MRFVSFLLLGLMMCFLNSWVCAEDNTVILRSTVKGNQEQPKVLYLLPWREADGIEWHYQPTASIMAEVFDEVDRDEFIRELRYRELINTVSDPKNAR